MVTRQTAYDAGQDHTLAGRSVDHDLAGHAFVDHANVPLHQSSFIGLSPIMQALYDQIAQASKSRAPVFITGETGTGKEVCAEAIHRHSPRRDKPFIAINCAAIPRDLLESELFGHVKGAFTGAVTDREGAATMAHGGTLFLDEVAEMAPDMQTKLLRFLQNFTFRKVGGNALEGTNVRIICATNRDPLHEIAAGHLREDLFFRLHVIPLALPPLYKRGEDVMDIAYALLKRYSREEGKRFSDFSLEVQNFFRQYRWPGNVRQLQNVIRYICAMHEGETVTTAILPPTLLHAPEETIRTAEPIQPLFTPARASDLPDWMDHMTLDEIERYVIESTIQRLGGNVPQAAAQLGVAPSTLYRRRLAWDEEELDR